MMLMSCMMALEVVGCGWVMEEGVMFVPRCEASDGCGASVRSK